MPKILIIEDTDQDQKIIRRFLTKAGYGDFTIVENGEKGIALAQEQCPDIVLLDTMLPGIDGFETCYQLKKVAGVKAAVIMMTGRVDAVDAQKAAAKGADDYCVKTADCAELLKAVRRLDGSLFPAVGSPSAPPAEGPPDAVPAAPVPGVPAWGPEKTQEAIRILSRELQEANDRLRELDQLKSKFVANVSHELRTPLTVIDAVISQLIAGIYGAISEEQRQKLLMAHKGSQRLAAMINDLLDFAKLEAQKVLLNKERFNVVEVVAEIRDSFQALAGQKGLRLETVCHKPGVEIEADRSRITQVLMNLVANALKFTDAGSIELSLLEHPDEVECRVADTGRGIAPADLPKVFGRFQQFDETRNPGGTGLGLSICKEIVELHGGEIRVQSRLNEGTTFSFILPKGPARLA